MIDIKIILGIVIVSGIFSIGIVYATTTSDSINLTSAPNSVFWANNGTSIAQTNYTGNGPGSYLTVRGYSGIVMKNLGTASFGSGNEILRINPTGLVMAPGTSYSWTDLGISLSRTDTGGSAFGNYLNERGFDGILFRTGGTGSYGTGVEQMRIVNPTGNVGIGTSTPTQKLDVAGNIRLTGNLTATPTNEFKITTTNGKDICIGAC